MKTQATTIKSTEKQVQFWSLLGPFIILLSATVMLFKMSAHWYLPVSILVGLPLCAKWKMKGLLASLLLLVSFFLFSYPNIDLEERYWHLGMGMVIALSFIILTLSFEEVQSLLLNYQNESASRLENFLKLDGDVKVLENNWVAERDGINNQLQQMTQELAKTTEEKQTFQKVVHLAKDELILLRKQHEKLIEELTYKKQMIAQLNERLEENDATIQSFVNNDAEQHVQTLTNRIISQEHQIEELSKKLHLENSPRISSNIVQDKEKLFDQLIAEKNNLTSTIAIYEINNVQFKANENEFHKKITEQEEKIGNLNILISEKEKALKLCENNVHMFETQKRKIKEYQDQIKNYQAEIKKIEEKNAQIKIDLLNSKKEREQLQKAKMLSSSTKSISNLNGNTRQVESLYDQLKDQFEERNKILHDTRKELFQAKEQLEALLKDQSEERQYGISQEALLLQSDLNHLQKEYEDKIHQYQEEIDLLYSIIGEVFKKDQKKPWPLN